MGFCCKISWLVRRPMSVEVNSSVSEGASTKQLVHGESHEPGDSTNSMSIDSAPPFRQNTNDSFFGKIRRWLKRKVRRSSRTYPRDFSASREVARFAGEKTKKTCKAAIVLSRTILDDPTPQQKPCPDSFENPDYILTLLKREEQLLSKQIQHLREQAYLIFWKAEASSLISERRFEIFKDTNVNTILHEAIIHPEPKKSTNAEIPPVDCNELKEKAKKVDFAKEEEEKKEKLQLQEEESRRNEKDWMWEELIKRKVSEVDFLKPTEVDKENQFPICRSKQNVTGVRRPVLQERNTNEAFDQTFTVILEKGAKKRLGLSVNGGPSCAIKDLGIVVANILDGSQADEVRVLQIGDEILAVNDKSLAGLTPTETAAIMKKLPPGPVVLKMRRSCRTLQKILDVLRSEDYE